MERYVYYSIALFTALIFFLYLYLLIEKLTANYGLKKIKKYEKEFSPYLDELFITLEDQYADEQTIASLKDKIKDKTARNIMQNKAIYYISNFKGNIRKNLIKLTRDTDLVKQLTTNMKTKDPLKLSLICKQLGELRNKSAVNDLLQALDIDYADIQYNALMAISKIGDVDSLIKGFTKISHRIILSERSLIEIADSFEGNKAELYEKMIGSVNPLFSSIFIKSAGNYLDLSFNDSIAALINDDNLEKRLAAIKAIGQTIDFRYIDQIIACLKDANWQVRAVAAKILGRFGDGCALPALTEALQDREWWVRFNSAEAVFKIPGGIKALETVFSGNDNFAKDILVSTMENCGVFSQLYLYEHSTDLDKRNMAKMVMNYINKTEIGEKVDESELA